MLRLILRSAKSESENEIVELVAAERKELLCLLIQEFPRELEAYFEIARDLRNGEEVDADRPVRINLLPVPKIPSDFKIGFQFSGKLLD